MAKYYVKCSCGHDETLELFGPYEGRRRKIEWYENFAVCSQCYTKKKVEEKLVEEILFERKLDELGIKKPSCYPDGMWNGKFYGSLKKGWCIYLNNEKTEISSEDKESIEQYMKKRAECKASI